MKNPYSIYQKIKNLNLTDLQKEYLLNCDDDGILTKKEADRLRSIGKFITLDYIKRSLKN